MTTNSYSSKLNSSWTRQYADSFHPGRLALRNHANLFPKVCHVCGVSVTSDPTDHVYPVSLGGLTTVGNMARICNPCNLAKNNSMPLAYMEARLARGEKTRFSRLRDYKAWLNAYTAVYAVEFKEQFELSHQLASFDTDVYEEAKQKWLTLLQEFHFTREHSDEVLASIILTHGFDELTKYQKLWNEIHSLSPEIYLSSGTQDSAMERFSRSTDPIIQTIYLKAQERASRGSVSALFQASNLCANGENALAWLEERRGAADLQEQVYLKLQSLKSSSSQRGDWSIALRAAGMLTKRPPMTAAEKELAVKRYSKYKKLLKERELHLELIRDTQEVAKSLSPKRAEEALAAADKLVEDLAKAEAWLLKTTIPLSRVLMTLKESLANVS